MTHRFPATDPSASLSDDEIRDIMRNAYHQAAQPPYLQSFAATVLQAPEADFIAMRELTLVLIRKYQLWKYLKGEHPPVLPVTVEGDLAKRRLAIVQRTCHGCGHVHQGLSECEQYIGGG